jgi:4-amino-4-deoxy-L-arabinose transferase-like glycosyltransferase
VDAAQVSHHQLTDGIWDARLVPWLRYRAPAAASRLLPFLAIALGAVPRLAAWLAVFPLHRDEALYGTWARLVASGRDSLLLTSWIDKPPLTIYLMAASLRLFGTSELALRLPGMLAAMLASVCLYGLARHAYGADDPAYGRRVAILASLILAAAPFAILFGPTAFTDPWLTVFLLAGAWAALARRPLLAGLSMGLAVASKQQGVLTLPLVLALLVLPPENGRTPSLLAVLRRWAWAILGLALIAGPLTYWDSLRWAKRPSFWDRSATTYGGLALAPPFTWPQRAAEWGTLLGYFYGGPLPGALLLAITAGAGLASLLRSAGRRSPSAGAAPATVFSSRARRVDFLLAVYIAGFLLLHFVVTFQAWDRYLLPLVPLTALLFSRGLLGAWDQSAAAVSPACSARSGGGRPVTALSRLAGPVLRGARLSAPAAFALLLAWQARLGAAGLLPVGSDHGAYTGLDQVVAILRAQPADAVIYHQWISWHYDYYLFDSPQERRWWGTPWKLADDAAATAHDQPSRSQWLAVPGWEDEAVGGLRLALASRRLTLAEVRCFYRADGSRSFTLYQIVPVVEHGR